MNIFLNHPVLLLRAPRILKNTRFFLCSGNSNAFFPKKIRKPTRSCRQILPKSKFPPSKQSIEQKVYKSQIIAKVYGILKNSKWDCALQQLESLAIKWDSYTVNRILKAHPPMVKAWLFFNWVSGKKGFKHDQFTYTTMLDIFGEAKRIPSMKFVFEQMKEKGIKIDVVTYTSLLHWMSNDGDVDGAVKMWKEMKAKGCKPTVVSYTAYMKILFDHKRVNEATCVYKEMLQSGLAPNCYTYTILMDYLACSGKTNEALEIFEKMQEAKVQPEKATCNILIETCSGRGETWAIMKILQYMKQNHLVLRHSVYQKAMDAFNSSGVSDMLLRQVNPHFIPEPLNQEFCDDFEAGPPTYDSVIDNGIALSFINRQNFFAVDSLLIEMMVKGIHLETDVLSKVVELNRRHCRPNGAFLAFEFGVKFGINFDRTAFLALIGLSVTTNSFQKMVEIVEEMVKHGHSLDSHLNSLLIHHLGCKKELVSAVKIFNLLPDDKKGTSEYTALISAYFSSGIIDKGLATYETMKNKGVDVALGTHCVLVAGLEKSGKFHELEYHRKEKKRLQNPSCFPAISMGEMICNLVFAGDVMVRHTPPILNMVSTESTSVCI